MYINIYIQNARFVREFHSELLPKEDGTTKRSPRDGYALSAAAASETKVVKFISA
jgi:hypothetical protein